MSTPQIGDYLYSSCAGEDYGQVIGVGVDANGAPVIDIECYVYGRECDEEFHDDDTFASPNLGRVEIPEDLKADFVILRDVQCISHGDGLVEINSPGNGCYRCNNMLWLQKKRTRWNDPYVPTPLKEGEKSVLWTDVFLKPGSTAEDFAKIKIDPSDFPTYLTPKA